MKKTDERIGVVAAMMYIGFYGDAIKGGFPGWETCDDEFYTRFMKLAEKVVMFCDEKD